MILKQKNEHQLRLFYGARTNVLAGITSIILGILCAWVTLLPNVSFWVYFGAFMFISLGLFTLFRAQRVTGTLSNNATSTIYRHQILSGKNTFVHFESDQVHSVHLDVEKIPDTRTSQYSSIKNEYASRLSVRLKDGETVMVVTGTTSTATGLTDGFVPFLKEAAQLAKFYSVELRTSGPIPQDEADGVGDI